MSPAVPALGVTPGSPRLELPGPPRGHDIHDNRRCSAASLHLHVLKTNRANESTPITAAVTVCRQTLTGAQESFLPAVECPRVFPALLKAKTLLAL